MTTKLRAGSTFPEITLPAAGGGEIRLGGERPDWQLIVVYRGAHCPICRKYLGQLETLRADFEAAGAGIVAVSGDPEEKAGSIPAEWGVSLPIAHGLSIEQMRALGLYVSEPRSPQETDRPFPEPGLFLLTPSGRIQVVDISNAPFARPDLEGILNGFKFIREKDYPIRGTAP
jgi:peroxiredoxin